MSNTVVDKKVRHIAQTINDLGKRIHVCEGKDLPDLINQLADIHLDLFVIATAHLDPNEQVRWQWDLLNAIKEVLIDRVNVLRTEAVLRNQEPRGKPRGKGGFLRSTTETRKGGTTKKRINLVDALYIIQDLRTSPKRCNHRIIY